MRFMCFCFCFWTWFLSGTMLTRSGRSTAEDSPEPLLAGAFAQEITPQKLPISINGNMQDHQATSVHDPLHARCIVLKSGETSLAIVICDSCAIPRTLIDKAKDVASKQTGIPENFEHSDLGDACSFVSNSDIFVPERSRQRLLLFSRRTNRCRASNALNSVSWNRLASVGVRSRRSRYFSIVAGMWVASRNGGEPVRHEG